jgi:hypothetical protein
MREVRDQDEIKARKLVDEEIEHANLSKPEDLKVTP